MIRLVISTILFSLTFQSPAQNKSVGLGPPPTNPNHFTISLLRSDGVLIPFAEYAQKQWVNPWPKSADSSKGDTTYLNQFVFLFLLTHLIQRVIGSLP